MRGLWRPRPAPSIGDWINSRTCLRQLDRALKDREIVRIENWLRDEGLLVVDPAVRATATNTGSGTSITCNKPAGTVDTDAMLASAYGVGSGGSFGTISAPAGWTVVTGQQGDNYASFPTWSATYQKTASSEGASYTFTSSRTADAWDITITTIQNPKSGTWLGNTAQNNGTGTTSTYTGVTATAGSLIYLHGNDWFNSGGLTPPTGFTERHDSLDYVATKGSVSAGATGDFTQTNSNVTGLDIWRTHTIEVLADAGGAAALIPDLVRPRLLVRGSGLVARPISLLMPVARHDLTMPPYRPAR